MKNEEKKKKRRQKSEDRRSIQTKTDGHKRRPRNKRMNETQQPCAPRGARWGEGTLTLLNLGGKDDIVIELCYYFWMMEISI